MWDISMGMSSCGRVKVPTFRRTSHEPLVVVIRQGYLSRRPCRYLAYDELSPAYS